jgi:hypothetical protein
MQGKIMTEKIEMQTFRKFGTVQIFGDDINKSNFHSGGN